MCFRLSLFLRLAIFHHRAHLFQSHDIPDTFVVCDFHVNRVSVISSTSLIRSTNLSEHIFSSEQVNLLCL